MGKHTFGALEIMDMILGVLQTVVGISLYYEFFALNFNSETTNKFENWLVPGYIIFVGFLVFVKNFDTAFHYKYFALLHRHLGLCFFFACISLFQFAYWNSRNYYKNADNYSWHCWLELISASCFGIAAILRVVCNCTVTIKTTHTRRVYH